MLRLRRHGDANTWLTLKGPRITGAHKSRVEIETPLITAKPNSFLNFWITEFSKLMEKNAGNTN